MTYELWELAKGGGFMVCSAQERMNETKLRLQHCLDLESAFETIRKHRETMRAKAA